MRRIKSIITMAVALAVAVLGVGASQAAAEAVSSSTKIEPHGTLLKNQPRPVTVHLGGKVAPDPGQVKLRQLINVRLNLPRDLTFWPAGTKPCKKDIGQNDATKATRPTAAVVADCPKSVVGDGTAVINIAGLVAYPVTDPVLTIFNAGKDGKGHPKLLIHGYSATVVPGGHGIMMTGKLVNGVLDVQVPTLAANSSVTEFTFDLPGKRGQDPRYTRSKCTSGNWKSNAVFTLGEYDANTGGYINKSALTTAPAFQNCVGKNGKAKRKFVRPKVFGRHMHHAKRGKRRAYFVKVKNVGRKTIKRVRIKAHGKRAFGKRYVGKLKPGHAKKVKVKVKFRKRGKIKVWFKVNGRGAKAKSKRIWVKVR